MYSSLAQNTGLGECNEQLGFYKLYEALVCCFWAWAACEIAICNVRLRWRFMEQKW
jgi:hypothetical protein